MTRVMVIGAPGSGKSTLGRAIGERLGLPVVNPDRVFWLPGRVERSRAECLRLVTGAGGCPERPDPAFLCYIPPTARRYRRKCRKLFADLPRGKAVHLRSPRAIARWIDGLAP